MESSMARYINEFMSGGNDNDLNFIVQDYLTKEGFTVTNINGENVWKKGSGWVASPQYIKVNVFQSRVHIEAWCKYALLPGVYVGEFGITGFFLWAIKALLKDRVVALENFLK